MGKPKSKAPAVKPDALFDRIVSILEQARGSVVRAVNTGISASIDSNGQIVAQVHQRSVRTAIAGAMVLGGQPAPGEPPTLRREGILVDSRVSLYSMAGDAFAIAVSLTCLALAAWLMVTRQRKEGADDAP